VIGVDAKLAQQMAPRLQRVLIVDPQPQAVQLLGELLRSIARSQVWSAPGPEKAMALAQVHNPQIIFTEFSGGGLNGLALAKAIRRSELACRQVPIVMVTGEATAAAIVGARDAGIHEFLRKPYTVKDLARRLEAVTLKSRDWVEAVGYIGPDRRRFNSGVYAGPRKRRSDGARKTPDAERVLQALKIVRSAVQALDSDWTQARRALLTQAADLKKAAVAVGEMKLMEAAAKLEGRLLAADALTGPSRPELLGDIQALLVFMPKEAAQAA
jgi:CheY-like chemotaxis protein